MVMLDQVVTEELKFDMVLMRVRCRGMWDEYEATTKGAVERWRHSLWGMLLDAARWVIT